MKETQIITNGAAPAASNEANNGQMAAVGQEFDPRALALSQDFAGMVGVKKEQSRVAIQKPPTQSFFYPHPDPLRRIEVAALVLKEDRETYVVVPSLCDELNGEWVAKVLVPCQTRQGGFYLWPIRRPGTDGRIDTWNESALEIADTYAGQWIRIMPNKELGAYDVIRPITQFPPPEWPESMDDLLKKAFHGRIIDRLDHPVVRQLRGIA